MLHPILEVIAGNRAALKSVADCNPTFMSTADKAAALTELVALQAQETELLLRLLAGRARMSPRTPRPAMPVTGWRMRPGRVTRTPVTTLSVGGGVGPALHRAR